MIPLANLRTRNLQPELMDNPTLEDQRFIGSLIGLRRVNTFTGSARILLPDLLAAAKAKAPEPLRVLDVACGGGDIAIKLWKQLRARGFSAEFHGCDLNPLASEHATAQADAQHADLTFFPLNILTDPIPPDYDVIMTSLFLHHLSRDEALNFLQAAAAAAPTLLIHDLIRSPAGYLLAQVGTRILGCNDVCHEDGPRSVAGAFTLAEAKALTNDAGLQTATVTPKFPFRFLLKWRQQ